MGTHCWRKEKALGEAGTPCVKAWNSVRIDVGLGTGVIPDGWSLKCGQDSAGSVEATSQQDPGKRVYVSPCSLVGGSLPIQIPIFKGEDCLNRVPIRIMKLHFAPGSYGCADAPTASKVVNFHGSMAEQQIFSCSGVGEL